MGDTEDGLSLDEWSDRVLGRCAELARITDEPGRITRSYLSPGMEEANARVARWMQRAGLQTEIDGAGNLIGTYPGREAGAPVLILGSHLDTVRDAGAYDGVLGVLLALATIEGLDGARLPFEVEVVGFADEEGLRFGAPFLGSKGLIGQLEPELLERKDEAGTTMAAAIRSWGGEPHALSNRYEGRQVLGYLEAHIEQGPKLEHQDLSLGIVEAISNARWLRLRFLGQAGHAGTTPTELRRDPMPAAAAAILAAEALAKEDSELVATVGQIEALPGAGNVIAGQVELSLDMRHPECQRLDDHLNSLFQSCRRLASERGLHFEYEMLNCQEGVKADPGLSGLLEQAAKSVGHEAAHLVIGAGHDALILARIAPVAMLLLRSPGGISHHPDESVRHRDVVAALGTLRAFVENLASLAPAHPWAPESPLEGTEAESLLQPLET